MATKDDYTNTVLTTGKFSAINGSTWHSSATGAIETKRDHDWFKVSLISGKAYDIDGSASSKYGLSVDLHDSTGKLIDKVGSLYIPSVSGDYYVDVGIKDNQGITKGNYYIFVSSYSKEILTASRSYINNAFIFDSAGKRFDKNYSFYKPFSEATYTFSSFSIFKPTVSQSYFINDGDNNMSSYSDDFGNTIDTATLIEKPTLNTSTIIYGSSEEIIDMDFFSIPIKENAVYAIDITAGNHQIRLFDKQGLWSPILSTIDDDAESDSYFLNNVTFFSTEDVYLLTSPKSIEYFLEVNGYGDYVITIKKLSNIINGDSTNNRVVLLNHALLAILKFHIPEANRMSISLTHGL